MKKSLFLIFFLLIIAGAMVLYAYRGTYGMTDIEFLIHINEQLVQESTFGESPTFAIWLEDPETRKSRTIFVTRRAAMGDWEGKAAVPVALPVWFEVFKEENSTPDLPGGNKQAPQAVTGATPRPGYFSIRARVESNSSWICRIEVNLSGDYNEYYPEYDAIRKVEDEYGTGQPAIVYKAEFKAVAGNTIQPEIDGMSVWENGKGAVIQPMKGITTARNIFDDIMLRMVKPSPKLIQ